MAGVLIKMGNLYIDVYTGGTPCEHEGRVG